MILLLLSEIVFSIKKSLTFVFKMRGDVAQSPLLDFLLTELVVEIFDKAREGTIVRAEEIACCSLSLTYISHRT